MLDQQRFLRFLAGNRQALAPFEDLVRSGTARIMYEMAHDVCATQAEADTAALRNIMLFAAEHSGNTLHATTAHLDDPMGRLRLWKIADAAGQDRWMTALNLRQLKNWHAKGLRNFSAEIAEHTAVVTTSFTPDEIDALDLLQPEKGDPIFGQLARIATSTAATAAGAVIAFGFWK